MKSEILAQGMTAADLDKLDLIADVQFFEPMGSAALNRKFYGIMPPGIYRGFQAVVRGGLKVSVGDSPVNVAAVDVDGFMITVQGRRPVELTVPVGRKVYGIIEANYAVGRKTTQVDINASIKAADIRIINPEEKRSNHVVIFSANLPAGTTEIRADQIELTERQEADIGSDAIDRHTKNYLNPHQVNKAQIDLGNVENYGVATVEEAQAGTATHKYMTPALTKTAIESISSPVPLPDVWIPFNDSLRMITGFGDYDRVYIGEQYLELNSRSASFERATTATYIDKSGVLRTAAINEPRFEKQGLLMEGQSTNLITNSSSVGSNYNSNLTVTNNPDGTKTVSNNASSQNTSGTAGRRMFIVGAQVQPNTTYTFSMVCSGRHMLIAYGAGLGETKSVVSGSESGIGCASITVTTGSSGGGLSVEIYGGTTSAHYDFPPFTFVGYQLEALPFASSYIPTNGTAVTRAADKCWIERLLNMQSSLPAGLSVALTFNKTGFTAGLSNYVVSLVDIGNHDRYGIATGDTITPNYTFDGYGNAFSGQLTATGGEATLVMSLGEDGARACRVNNMFVNGTTGDTTRKVVTQGMIKFCDRVGEGTRAWGHVRNFRIWHRSLSAAQIKGLA